MIKIEITESQLESLEQIGGLILSEVYKNLNEDDFEKTDKDLLRDLEIIISKAN
tara:strand:+ start:761 stop:922 length:162 start_codon:yes stop_codon:yes gene_type:complete